MQVSEHADEHAADGVLPAQLSGGVQVEVDATCRHEFESVAQVATVWLSWHMVPSCVQMLAGQVHAALPFDTAQVWVLSHVFVVTHAVHPPGCSWQVWTAPPTHCVVPAVHGLSHVAPRSPLDASTVALASAPPSALPVLPASPPEPPLPRVPRLAIDPSVEESEESKPASICNGGGHVAVSLQSGPVDNWEASRRRRQEEQHRMFGA